VRQDDLSRLTVNRETVLPLVVSRFLVSAQNVTRAMHDGRIID
jgi:hypothetical protein